MDGEGPPSGTWGQTHIWGHSIRFISVRFGLDSRLSFPATEPPDPRRVSEGFEKGSPKGCPKGSQKGLRRVLEGF